MHSAAARAMTPSFVGPLPTSEMDDATTQPYQLLDPADIRVVEFDDPTEPNGEVLASERVTNGNIVDASSFAVQVPRGLHPHVEKVELTRDFFNDVMARAADHMQLENDLKQFLGQGLYPYEKLSERGMHLAKLARVRPFVILGFCAISGVLGALGHLLATR